MKTWITFALCCAFTPICLAAPRSSNQPAPQAESSIHLQDDQPVTLRFYGSRDADLFTREVAQSFQGVLDKNFYSQVRDGFPAGFISASLPGFPWAGTMWTRDAGTFLRELVMRGYYQHASLLAECLMQMVEKNRDGFYSFPRYFRGSARGTGTELDGTGAIVIGMVLLWERLPAGDPVRADIQNFLLQSSSPIDYFRFVLKSSPLVPGTGEFGCGMGVSGECYNVVQNNLVALALTAAAQMAGQLGKLALADQDRGLARGIWNAMDKYLVAKDGSWFWAVGPGNLKPAPAVLNARANLGTGSMNGVASMYADVLGFLPLDSSWPGIQHSAKTFEDLYNTPVRKTEFERYGMWSQTDDLGQGLMSGASYGQGYATQVMLLLDKLTMAGKSLSWLAGATYKPVPQYKLPRSSPYYFYERMYSPDAVGKFKLAVGCGALNLVNVSEPLKVARLLLGVDDHSPGYVRLVPRIPPGWKGVDASNWPIWADGRIVRAHIHFEQKGSGAELSLTLAPGQSIGDLEVRMPSSRGYVWKDRKHVTTWRLVTQ